ncbi:uncharacterized protein LOC124490592 [Dermatophagoides farinae]|uniref:uncharacterized protein LOC124490592 n=1 Tax=Dermatophagoides farinae TaxID=6954 RepID=UPI003F6307FD
MASILKRLNSKIDIKSKHHQQQSNLLLNPRTPDWFDHYSDICTQLCFAVFESKWFNDIHSDVIRDLCDDSLGNEIHLHLLSLLEQMFPLYDYSEKVEETFHTLLSLIERNKSPQRIIIIARLYYCATALLLFFKESIIGVDNISKSFTNFIRTLLAKSCDQQSFEYDICLDCLREISATYPEMLIEISNDYKPLRTPRNIREAYCMLPLFDSENDLEKIRNLMQQFDYTPDIKFYHICMDVHHLILSGRYNTDSISLLILRPFLSKFIISNQIHQIQFALKLLIEFGFDIFSSREEELFLRQMVQACTIPSIPVGHRLLLLAFIRIAFESIYEPPLNSPPLSLLNSLHPLLFDGPDTQEKKLQIMNQSAFIISDDEFFNMLYRLHRQSSMDKRNYERAANGLFHLMNQALRKRTQLTDRLIQLLLDSFFIPQYLHYIKRFCIFCRDHKELAQELVDNFIAKLMMMTKEQDNSSVESLKNLPVTITSYKVYIVYLEFINWFLSVAHRQIHLTEFQIEFLINFIHRNIFHYADSSTMALQCCTSILYYQRVTHKVKGALFNLLEWLRNERKSDLEASSLAQIYLLALRTLTEASIKQVFTSDEEEFLLHQTPEIFEQYLLNVKNTLPQCPIRIERSAKININRQIYSPPPFIKIISFNVSLDSRSKFNRIFAIEIRFSCRQNDRYEKNIQIPYIEDKQNPIGINLPIDFLIHDTIQLSIEMKFVDMRGNIYDHLQNQIETISFEDLLIAFAIDIDQIAVIKMDNILTKHSDSIRSIICVPDYHTIQSFIDYHQWLEPFIITDLSSQNSTLSFVIATTPDRITIGSIQIINNCVNIEIESNHYGLMPALFSRFRRKSI